MQSLYYDVSPVAAHLVATGSAEQLAQSGDLDIETPNSPDHLVDEVLALNLEHYRSNLKRLHCGERLVLYADLNTAHLNHYLRNLLLLMPLQIRSSLNWSEFVFHSLETLDLSIVHSSRYAAPEGDTVEFQADGDNSLGDLSISSEAADDYIANLAQQLEESNREKLAALFTQVEIADQPESAGD